MTPGGWVNVRSGSMTARVGPQPGVADPGLDLQRQHVHHADGRALGAGARRGGDGDERLQRLRRRLALADRHVDVVHQLTGVGGEQVDRLAGVDARPAADRDEGVPRAGRAGLLDRGDEALVGRLDVDAVEDTRLDAELRHLVGHPLRDPGGGHARVGDDQDALDAVLAEVVADLVGGATAELQLGCAVGEDGLGIGGRVVLMTSLSAVGRGGAGRLHRMLHAVVSRHHTGE